MGIVSDRLNAIDDWLNRFFLVEKFGCYWDEKTNPHCLYCKTLLQPRVAEDSTILDCPRCTPKYPEDNPRVQGDERGWYPLRRPNGAPITLREAKAEVERRLDS
jgi:hypothetical protein